MSNSVSISNDSRYKSTNLYADENGKAYFNVWEPIVIAPRYDDVYYRATMNDVGRLDLLAYQFYSDSRLWWVIAYRNNIADPIYSLQAGDALVIPSNEYVQAILQRKTNG